MKPQTIFNLVLSAIGLLVLLIIAVLINNFFTSNRFEKKLDKIGSIPVVNVEGQRTGEVPLHEAISRIHNLEQANTQGLVEVLNKLENLKLTTSSIK